MRTRFLALLVGAALGAAGAAAGGGSGNALVLNDNQAVTHAGVTCTAYAGTTPTNANLVCVRDNLQGYGVIISQENVAIARRVKGKVKIVFTRPNR